MVSNLYLFVVGYVYSKLTTTYTCWMTDVLSKFQACLNVKIPIFDDQSNYMAWALVWTESNWNGSDWCDWWHTKKKLKPKLSAIFIHFLSLIFICIVSSFFSSLQNKFNMLSDSVLLFSTLVMIRSCCDVNFSGKKISALLKLIYVMK